MRREHPHIREWMHMHKVDWHRAGVHMGHWIHDPRFWAIIAVTVAVGLLILGMWLTAAKANGTYPYHGYPMYPYLH
jgi:hypothetical protein